MVSRFMTKVEIVEDMSTRLDDSEWQALTCMHKDDLHLMRNTLGHLIRARYKLWYPNNPWTVSMAGTDHPDHPHTISAWVIHVLWKSTQQE
jgi:hypothetical protein